jgi:endonuclease/exonuclease/phosphatase (EEP) superfamily protein YafD
MNNSRKLLIRINAAFIATVLWGYFFFVSFVLFFAKYTPDWIVVVRISASILSDLVWIPFGIIIWAKTAIWLNRSLFKKLTGGFTLFATGAVLTFTTVFFVLIFQETAFRFLFIPLSLLSVKAVYKYVTRKAEVSESNFNIPLVFLGAVFIFYYGGQLLPRPEPKASSGTSLSIMTYNVLTDAGVRNRLKAIETIKRESPDIACCIETDPYKDPALFKSELGAIYPYMITNRKFRYSRIRAIIISKYPIKAIDFRNGKGKNEAIDFSFTEIDLNGKIINLVTFHLLTVGHHFEKIRNKSGDLKQKIALANEDESIIDNGKYSQVKKISEIVNSLKGPVILCGDLNDTPNSRVYEIFNRKYRNAFSSAGWGIGSTFGKSWIEKRFILRSLPHIEMFARDVIRIDHIFIGGEIEIITAKAIQNAQGSDHKPVQAFLKIL